MTPALMSAYAMCGVALFLQPQKHLPDVHWPTHASLAVPRGWIRPADQLVLLEDGQPTLSQIEVAARWPDGSPKWLHVCASFRYAGGHPASYELEKRSQPPGDVPDSPLSVVDDPRGITINTGAVELLIERPFAGISLARLGSRVLVEGPGGPRLVDQDGIVHDSRHDERAEVVIEQQGPAQVTVRASGWYRAADQGVAPFCRFVTRISAFAGSAIVKFDHATIFAEDMHQHQIAELAFGFATPGVKRFSTSDLRGGFGPKLAAAYFAQTSADRLLNIAQPSGDPRDLKVKESRSRFAGCVAAELATARLALLTKDFRQKCPKEIKVAPDELVYYGWPTHGEFARPDKDATRPEKIYKFQCFHTGKLLDSRLPVDYFQALQEQTDTQECKAEYARAANLMGVAMHNEFALVCLPPAASDQAADDELSRLQKLFVQSPIARASPAAIEASRALGSVAAFDQEFPQVQRAVHDGMLGYARSIERYGDFGWAIYGNTHSAEWMNPAAAGVAGGRPSLHRVWNNNHYQHVSTSWRLFALDGDPQLLRWCRICTDNYCSVGQVRFDPLRGFVDRAGDRQQGPQVKFHHPGAFWHCKGLVPWGGRDYRMDKDDTDAALTGHWPDPSGLLLAWLIDANRWAKEGYELWLQNVKFPSQGTRREINTTLVHAITAYEYQPRPEILAAIRGMARSLSSEPLPQQRPGPIWEPTWLTRYQEMFPDDEAFKKFVMESADSLGTGVEAIWSLALSATAYRISSDKQYLLRHGGTLARVTREVFYDAGADKRWDMYGFAPGPAGDGHFMLQWPWFRAALKEASITSLSSPPEPGQYFCGSTRYDNKVDVAARGSKILILKDQGAAQLNLQATTLSGGDIHATSLELLSPESKVIFGISRLPMSAAHPTVTGITRPSTWAAAIERYPLPADNAGLYTLLVGSYQIGLFQPLTDLPECQVLRNATQWGTADPAWLLVKLTRGYLVPLDDRRIELTFSAMGVSDGSFVELQLPQGKPLLRRYLRAGDSASVTLSNAGETRGPWLLDAVSNRSGFLRMTIRADGREPLLYGHRLEDVQAIHKKLPPLAPANP